MSIIDIFVFIIFLAFIIVGYKQGVVRELIQLIGLIIIFYIAFLIKNPVGNFLCQILPFFKFTGSIEGLVSLNILMYQIIAFILVFSILLSLYMFILKISKILQKIVNMTILLWWPSKVAGAVVGFIEGYIVVFIFLVVLMIPFGDSILSGFKYKENMIYNSPIISKYTYNFTSSIKEVYVLGKKVSNKEISTNDANLKTIDIMLKNNLVSKDTITSLVNKHKLDEVKDINNILNNY